MDAVQGVPVASDSIIHDLGDQLFEQQVNGFDE